MKIVSQEEKYYVYELAYPDGTPFYIGKGCGNRINMHEQDAIAGRNVGLRKTDVIKAIQDNGGQVLKRKIAFFEDEQEALMYEWAMAYMTCVAETLTNAIRSGRSGNVSQKTKSVQKQGEVIQEQMIENVYKPVCTDELLQFVYKRDIHPEEREKAESDLMAVLDAIDTVVSSFVPDMTKPIFVDTRAFDQTF